jgi:hypothetical protein
MVRRVSSHYQQGGITAQRVSIHVGRSQESQEPSRVSRVHALLACAVAAIAVLTYFGIGPFGPNRSDAVPATTQGGRQEMVEELRSYTDEFVQEAWSTRWSAPHAFCTPEMPDGWTIIKTELQIEELTNPRGNCGEWVRCGDANVDTPTRACRTTQVQGFDKGEYGGWGRIKTRLLVTWLRPK